jgi:hypothetical protein
MIPRHSLSHCLEAHSDDGAKVDSGDDPVTQGPSDSCRPSLSMYKHEITSPTYMSSQVIVNSILRKVAPEPNLLPGTARSA